MKFSDQTVNTEAASRIDALIQKSVTADGPGASVLVLDKGQAILKKAYGLADCEASVPNTVNTNFRLASVSKQFTAMAVMQLMERGRLTRDTRLTDLFPRFPAYGREITVHHLLVHSSGLPDYEDYVPADQTEQVKDADVLELLERQDRGIFASGTRFSYSNSGYCVLARIIETVSGESFPDFLKQNIFDPLGMQSTVAYEAGSSVVTNRAYGYTPQNDGFVRTDQSVTSATLGDGGIYSSIEDLERWDAALYTARLAGAEVMAQTVTPWQSIGEPEKFYGYGWFVYDDHDSQRLEHDGTTIGFRNYIIRVPDRQQTVIVLMNRNDGRPKELAANIISLIP